MHNNASARTHSQLYGSVPLRFPIFILT